MTYSTALVAIDLTEDSAQVLQVAREMREALGTRLHVVSVVKPLTQVYGGLDVAAMSAESIRFEQEAERQAKTRLDGFASEIGADLADSQLLRGSPAAEIRDAAERISADLVITGTHGRHGLGLLLGSTASGVLHGIHCDVLAVRIKDDA